MPPRRAFPGIVAIEHRFDVPLRHDEPGGERIEVFAREVRAPRAADEDRPHLLFLQGGPGFPAPRPTGADGWIATALEEFHVVLLDQRGTGLSTPADARTLPARGDAEAQAEYLTHFRADAIVRDAELVRERLLGDRPWSVLGQSYGGFCATTYLSIAPGGVREAFVTGGLPPVGVPLDDVYRSLIRRQHRRLELYFERYPEDRERWERVPDRWLRTVGREAGMSTAPEELHYLIEYGPESLGFAERARSMASLATAPLYAVLHEPIYAEGEATRWAAQRMLDELGAPLLAGEMIVPAMFEDDPGLRPLAEAAHLLAEKDDWPALYDRAALAANDVPVFAAVYLDDPYVDADFSLATARMIRGARTWATNELQHDGLRTGGALKRLLAMARGEA
ncbi:MAG TPA: alpha/beta fold hydrolase [Solirubrobacteraceae bacterium]|jgi:pimeloyl-ACP methyl ester carboxylesterase|nr:alpha/beta fold hydrolase [Solirubrobacteraceae bacterium]